MYGRNFVKVPYEDDLSMNVDNIIKEITPDTELLILLNPNNPMGNYYSEDEFKRIYDAVKANEVTLLIDEAYHYFYPKTFINYALNEKHVFVTRTFSKLFSMAGCRLGYVAGWPEGIRMVQKLCTPHNTNAFALKFAEHIISNPSIIEDLISKFNEGRTYLLTKLKENGYLYKGEAGNFLFIKVKTDADLLVKRMKEEKGILIKSYPNVGEFGTCLRVSIGEKEYMQRLLKALFQLDK